MRHDTLRNLRFLYKCIVEHLAVRTHMRALAPGEEEQNEGPYYETDFPCSSVPVLTKRDYLGSHELHDMRRISWDKVLTRLIAFLDKSGGRYPRQNPSNGDHEEKFLGHFVNRQRTQARSSDSKRKGRLTRERVEKLESLPNWRWAARKPGARHTLRAPVNITAGGPAPARASCTWSDSTPGKLEPLLQLQNRRVRDTVRPRTDHSLIPHAGLLRVTRTVPVAHPRGAGLIVAGSNTGLND